MFDWHRQLIPVDSPSLVIRPSLSIFVTGCSGFEGTRKCAGKLSAKGAAKQHGQVSDTVLEYLSPNIGPVNNRSHTVTPASYCLQVIIHSESVNITVNIARAAVRKHSLSAFLASTLI